MLVAGLSACGGGGDQAGDVADFAILPSSMTYTDCVGGVDAQVSIHTINGGLEPFRVRVTVQGLELGLTNANNEFVEPPASAFNSEGDLVLTGRDPKFAVRATLACSSSVDVVVLDNYSESATVSIKTEAPATPE